MGGGTEEAHRGYRDLYTRPFHPLEGGVKRGAYPPENKGAIEG